MTRRELFGGAAGALAGVQAQRSTTAPAIREVVPLNGAWQFRPDGVSPDFTEVTVPHTWQVSPQWAEYLGAATYRRTFYAPAEWGAKFVRIEFEAVFHTAVVSLNGQSIGEHRGKGYTAFTLDATPALRPGAENLLEVRVNNAFDDKMLPRGTSYDWTPDGGIIRPVSLLVTPEVFIERVDVDAGSQGQVDVRVAVRNAGRSARAIEIGCEIAEEDTDRTVLRRPRAARVRLNAGESREVALPRLSVGKPRLWHFDHPHLYRLSATLTGLDSLTTTFGFRTVEVRDGGLYLNGERVWLMGVERMGGSHPEYGMAESSEWLRHDHDDLKELNCVFSRVHWQQDRWVLDYCDRHGILIQVEVPTWGPGTFAGMRNEPDPGILRNGLEQLREMIRRDRNHPSVFAWGLCNEIGGQNPPAYAFAKRMYEEAKRLDPHRLASYASNSLEKTPGQDVAGLVDFVEWNEYYESWMKGTPEDMRRNLEAIHAAFPGKMIVISEYGYCECRPEFTAGDPRRIRVMREHTAILRDHPYVGGAIFFCYNDYRTHIGDKGVGVMKQRVHGVVDLYGRRKESFAALREEASPIEELKLDAGRAMVRTRSTLPAYTLEGYKLRWIVYGYDDLPMERYEAALPRLAPGESATVPLHFRESRPRRLQVDVMRATGFSALTATWTPRG